ncbi:hypothetical protein JOC77_000143 [Peribacillus deserti]|uniref:Uncharacterized protein n=1 Tax=Peribacillus deserti TaxID=673318 RepID=A0ABS2QC63_9BACI|nr:hypothetical protein [Peribacillus deserti]MBM7690740.1 hypothetical protein [Peribacillus deserti]
MKKIKWLMLPILIIVLSCNLLSNANSINVAGDEELPTADSVRIDVL